MQRTQIIVRGVILLLLVLIAFLVYYYWRLLTPPTQVEAGRGAGVTHIRSMYGFGPGKDDQLQQPDALAVDGRGDFYVSDSGHARIMVFDKDGDFLRVFGVKGTNKGEMVAPLGIEVAGDKVYVASMILSKMMIYSKEGKFLREVLMDRPIRIKAHKSRLWITTPGQIWVTDMQGKVLRTYLRKGRAPGQLNYPNGLAFDSKDNVFISDTMNNRIQILNKRGDLVGVKGEPTKSLNEAERLFGLGMGIAVDDTDRIYVADAFHSSIRVFDHDGNQLAEMGVEGSNDGQLDHLSEIVYLGGDRFAVADKNNDRIQILALTAPTKAGQPAGGSNWLPYLFAFLATLIVVWTVWRILKERQLRAAE